MAVIDWTALTRELSRQLDRPLGDLRARSVGGGDINEAYQLAGAEQRFFVKINRAERIDMFAAERHGLEALARCGAIRVPRVFAVGVLGSRAYIVMEYIQLGGQPAPARLAASLANLHACCDDRFGFDGDNTIGSTPQINTRCDDWIEFWREYRLGYQLRLASESGFGDDLIETGQRLAHRLDQFFDGYQPRPSLLHGDLWSGNWSADQDGAPVIYDPACYYGDHEADLAMMELFGQPGDEFFRVYHEHFPIDPGYALRRDLYNLYHILNHANLFGGGYAASAMRTMRSLLAQV